MPFLARVFRIKDSHALKKAKAPAVEDNGPAKPTWTDAWQRTEVAPEEVQGLLRGCTQELKARGLQTPFLLLPFRPLSDASAARTFIRNYFNKAVEKGSPPSGDTLAQELRLTDPIVLCAVLKWCWSRLPGGVVTWEAYELFKVGEQDSQLARDAFATFIPISVDSDSRSKIIFDFFDLLTAIAAYGKSNGLGGRKLSRYAGWWAFEHTDTGNGFEAAYKNWASAADATSHLFFAYLRSLSPDSPRGMNSISTLPIALQTLLQATEYPPETPALLQVSTTKVVMIVDTVSATPFALLRRAKNFEYRDSDKHLQEFASFEDPLRALTDECLRVLKCIASTNQSAESDPTSRSGQASWSRFEDLGFGATLDSDLDDGRTSSMASKELSGGIISAPQSGGDLGRPTTPSWADFMSSGFSDENVFKGPMAPVLLPPDKVLPPINAVRGQSSQSHKRTLDAEASMDPGELASITTLDLDDSFWWVWISSLAGEEPTSRKAVFGRCALLETVIKNTKWLVLEEQIKGAAPEPEPGAYIVEKKRFFGFSTRKRLGRRKSSGKKVSAMEESYKRSENQGPQSKSSIGPDQHARIQAAAAALQRKHREQEREAAGVSRRNIRDTAYSKTSSVMTLQPSIMNEASQAMKWASNYDKNAYKVAYMENSRAGTGAAVEELKEASRDSLSPPASPTLSTSTRQAPPPLPKDDVPSPSAPAPPQKDSVATDGGADRQKDLPNAPVESSAAESLPKSRGAAADSARKLRKKPANPGIKGMFGTTKRKPEPESRPSMKPIGAGVSAVAVARAALEDKAKVPQEQLVRPSPNGSSTLKKKPVPGTPAAETPNPTEGTPVAPKAVVGTPEPEQPEAKVHPGPQISGSNGDDHRAQREAEYDSLSSVDTHERTAADHEFSRFDQGPLVDQPAFAPEDSPVSETFSEKKPVDNVSVEPKEENKALPQANPSHDRWAQIRKNAAERAAQFEQMRMNEDDSGNTSEEESFDARAARIKARVAELTGKMA
ncbi:hypothetical protein BDV28DRAFT_50539 [Aspergillus coremiiformis]|uniref:Meiotically up-regulated protein Msb1/Mug8 domain-containing protein n=1 Tax=Aspergillus coremiiformis TaxID=138285 RepID=A0A5N6YWY1_9EURO|nr:hypothetical protein BDV28DRAFT_50539 [Aspergillus coremiiformis]